MLQKARQGDPPLVPPAQNNAMIQIIPFHANRCIWSIPFYAQKIIPLNDVESVISFVQKSGNMF